MDWKLQGDILPQIVKELSIKAENHMDCLVRSPSVEMLRHLVIDNTVYAVADGKERSVWFECQNCHF